MEQTKQTTQANEKTYLSVREAAQYTGYSIGYIYRLVKDRAIPFHAPNGGRIIFARVELDEWITGKGSGNGSGQHDPDDKSEYLVIR